MKLSHEQLLSKFAFNCNLRPSSKRAARKAEVLRKAREHKEHERKTREQKEREQKEREKKAAQAEALAGAEACRRQFNQVGAVQVDPGFSQLTPLLISGTFSY